LGTNRLAAWWQILRAGNSFTAASNVVAGAAVAGGFDAGAEESWLPLILLIVASVMLYEAGMVLNDRFDIEQDKRDRPGRPIPSGRITPRAALCVGLLLLGGGVLLACLAGWIIHSSTPAVVGILLALSVVAYDGSLKKWWCGPLVMGVCRMLNVLLGASLAAPWQSAPWLVAIAIGTYTVGLTWFARSEAKTSPRRNLMAGSIFALAGLGLVAMLPLVSSIHLPWGPWTLLWIGIMGWVASACWRAMGDPSPKFVQAGVIRMIVLFVVIDAVLCLARVGPGLALVILSLLIPMRLASRWAPMT
jgi:4-hydroxybenzoate polyprenyltransferase